MALQQIGQKLLALKDKSWLLVAEALRDIDVAFRQAYQDMGWFEISKTSSGLRKDRLEGRAIRLIGSTERFVVADRNGDLSTVDAATVLTYLGFYKYEYTLTANTTITAPVAATDGARLVIYVFADASTFYTVAFDPADFTDTGSNHSPDIGKATVYEFIGRSDGKWWPLSIPRVSIDPLA